VSARRRHSAYRAFLKTIPLAEYSDKYRPVKWVEQDLRKILVQAMLDSLYQSFWHGTKFPGFSDWFGTFWKSIHTTPNLHESLQEFTRYYFNREDVSRDTWFKLGFRARLYRIWVSFLTQLDLCYTVDKVSETRGQKSRVQVSTKMDQMGVDLVLGPLEIGVSKTSQRKEARLGKSGRTLVLVPYPVWDLDAIRRRADPQNTRVTTQSKQKYQKQLSTFNEYYIRLPNGFVVFADRVAEMLLDNINDPARATRVMADLMKKLA
jgi:hypothetical protein